MTGSPPVYLALDLWQALGLDSRDFEPYYDRNGWASTWSNLLHHVRVQSGVLTCGKLTAEAESCVLLVHSFGPHMGASDVGLSEPLPFPKHTGV